MYLFQLGVKHLTVQNVDLYLYMCENGIRQIEIKNNYKS